jgi:hypothetical protein
VISSGEASSSWRASTTSTTVVGASDESPSVGAGAFTSSVPSSAFVVSVMGSLLG